MKILIAEDDPVSRALMVDILGSAQAGYDPLPVEDGAKAWETLEAHPDIKLAILDLAMPGMNGVDWLTRVRKDPRFSALPVIICTGNTDRTTVAAVAARGISNFLVKPFTRGTVLEKVALVCRPSPTSIPVLRDLPAARQRYGIDQDAHRELLGHYVRLADMWAADARRATDHARLSALAVRASALKQMLASLGAAAVAARLQDAEAALAPYRTKTASTEIEAGLRKTQHLGDTLQPDIDRLREMLDTIG
ncbi:response regulator [Opitutus sp. ER46]|uniref:response regulator n=1 Tax=Opitutus sp. ER46 TaxID=2161864 RepID=UPI000D2F766A|nr:response regulator [Opitutus sp. ER46]PTX91137.1 hypothetical protein DB354_21115 [Opitutus sp. ER46]